MNDINKILAKARDAKPKERLLLQKEAEIITANQTNYSPIKGTIMKISAIFIPLLAAYFWVASNADNQNYKDENKQVSAVNSKNTISGDTLILSKKSDLIYIPILHLSENELENIGISKKENNYVIPMEAIDNSSYSWKKDKMKELGYQGENFQYRELVNFGVETIVDLVITKVKSNFGIEKNKILSKSEFDKDKNKGIYPFKIKLTYGDRGNKAEKGTHSSTPTPPNISDGVGGLLSVEINNFIKEINKTGKNINNYSFVAVDREKYFYLSHLIPLALPFENEDYWVNAAAFFVASPKLLKKLPAKYQDIIKEKYEITEFLDLPEKLIVESKKKESLKIDKSINLQGINLIELKDSELAPLGLKRIDDKILLSDFREMDLTKLPEELSGKILNMFIKNNLDTSLKSGYFHNTSIISHQKIENGSTNYGVDWTEEFPTTPIFTNAVTNIMDEGVIKHMSHVYSWSDDHPLIRKDSSSKKAVSNLVDNYNKIENDRSFSDIIYSLDENGDPIIKSLIPVRINIGDKSNLNEGDKHTEITLWYIPTPEFITSLPPRYSEPLMREFDIVASVEAGDMTIGEACEALGGKSYLGICPNGDFALMNLYPQPAITDLELLVVSEKTSKLNVEIYDLNGKFISEFGNRDIVGGKNNIRLNVANLKPGTYALSLRSEDGSRVNKMFLKK